MNPLVNLNGAGLARLIEVIEVTNIIVGRGTEENPGRRITRYYGKDGILLTNVTVPDAPNAPMIASMR